MIDTEKLKKQLLRAPYAVAVNAEIGDLCGVLAERFDAIAEAAAEYVLLIDRAADFLDMFVFFSDLDHSLSRIKFVFADLERAHYNWSRFLMPPDDSELFEEFPPPSEDDPIPITGEDFYPEDPNWIEANERILNAVKRLMLKRGEDDTFWFFDDPFCDESYLQGEVSSNIAEIYADLVEIKERIQWLEEEWNEEVYGHVQDLVEYHTTHHIMVLLRPIQYLIGKDI